MAVRHTVLQFKIPITDLPNKDNVLDKIEKLLARDLQDRIVETFRSNVNPILMLIAEAGR